MGSCGSSTVRTAPCAGSSSEARQCSNSHRPAQRWSARSQDLLKTSKSARPQCYSNGASKNGQTSSNTSSNGASSSSSSRVTHSVPSVAAAPPPAAPPVPSPTRTSQSHLSATQDWSNGSGRSGMHAVVIGGGWAGFGASLALAKAGAQVTLLDAAENPGGLSSAFRTPGGQLVEPGIKGFWYQYANITSLVSELGILDPFTPFTCSSFWSPDGLEVESPIFQDLPRLPTPLGSFVHTAPLFRDLPLLDRASAAPLVKPLLEHDLDEGLYRQYDGMSAYELFRSAGVTKQLYDKFLAPMLLVTLFAPPTELSAAAALGALYYFALAHQPDFDVRWGRGPIGKLIFEPLVAQLKKLDVAILGSRRVETILPLQDSPSNNLHRSTTAYNSQSSRFSSNQLPGVVVVQGPNNKIETYQADAVIVAAGIPALQHLVVKSPVLAAAEDFRSLMGVSCSDVLAVRLWLEQKLQFRTPSNVVAGFDDGVGGTFFQLDGLQDMYRKEPGSVLEFDLYHAEPLIPLSDDAITRRLLQHYLAPALRCSNSIQPAALKVKDSCVLRFKRAVTKFSPGSHSMLPNITTSIPNVFVAGDCVKQGPGTHGCKGLSQEKAYVSGLQAGNHAARMLGLRPAAQIIPVEPDEPHVTAAKEVLRTQRWLASLFTNGLHSSSRTSSRNSRSSSTTKASSSSGSSSSGSSRSSRISGNKSSSSTFPVGVGGSSRPGQDISAQQQQDTQQLRQALRQQMADQVVPDSKDAE